MKKAARRPRGFGAFDDLMRKLDKVPKEEVARLVEKQKRKGRKK